MNDFLAADPQAPPVPQPPDAPLDPDHMVGPVELNLLERVEYGLAVSEDTHSRPDASCDKSCQFEGPREVIFASGWADVHQIFAQMRTAFLTKTILAVTGILCFRHYDQRLWPVAAVFLLASLLNCLLAARQLYLYWASDASVRMPILVDLNEALCHQVFFLGVLLYFAGEMSARPLPLFAVPGLLYSVLVLLYYSEEAVGVSLRKFMIVEWVQLALLAFKLSGLFASTWNYTLFLFMAGAIYLAVLGLFLAMILSCSLVGVFQGRVVGWKVRALAWITWNYLSSGVAYVVLIKAVLHFYNEDGTSPEGPVTDFRGFKNEEGAPAAIHALTTLAAVSLLSLLPAFFLRRDITRFLARVVYKNEIRKEVSLRAISKSFAFKLIQASATYFLRPEQAATDDKTAALASPLPPSKFDRDPCFLCCDAPPNTMLDPCGHGGACKDCVVSYLRHQGERCPICKQRMTRIFVLEFDEEDGRYITKGEIKLGD